ncbi:hypothetical protein BJY00DRAFT_19994 [Aspergillus carlsbadensis]|nr:hypothetical protein BJY00DRAFT_19994 [Aspergillus carlsbadensis]
MSTLPGHGSDDRREFACVYCQKTFRRLEHLQRHTRRHTNEKPFACRCGAMFTRRDLLRRHERIVHHSDPHATNAPRRISDDEQEFLIQSPRETTPVDIRSRVLGNPPIHLEQPHLALQTPDSSGSFGSRYFQQSPRNLSTPLASQSCPVSNHVPHQAAVEVPNSQRIWFQRNHDQPPAYTRDFPTIFPSPHLSLATQIVPHSASPKVTHADRSRLLFSLGRVDKLFPQPNLPSYSALTRYMAGYFTGFYAHVPFTHTPTFSLESCSPELCLAMMALGAVDRFEFAAATKLFYLSKALLFDSQQHRVRAGTGSSAGSSGEDSTPRKQLIDEVRCLLCLAYFTSWQSDPSIRNETCVLVGLLGQSLRLSGLEETPQSTFTQHHTWQQWSRLESERRTKLFAFCFLSLQSIAYDMPPSIWCHEINLKLPCSCPEWTAPDETSWEMLRRATTPNEQGLFNDALEILLAGTKQVDPNIATVSPVGNYILIYGLLHKIMWTRRSMSGNLSRAFSENSQTTLESALHQWTLSWQQTPESNLEPLDPNGPLPFTSSALLSLAYLRNCFGISHTRKLSTWAPAEIAQALQSSFPVERKRNTLLAAYHATNLLSTLVSLGVQYLKHNQAILWSIEAALCGLECSVFLEKWIRRVMETMRDVPLTDHEIQLVTWIQDIVYEGLSSANEGSLDQSPSLAMIPERIITVWSHIMQGNSPYPFIKMIGDVLVAYTHLSARS